MIDTVTSLVLNAGHREMDDVPLNSENDSQKWRWVPWRRAGASEPRVAG